MSTPDRSGEPKQDLSRYYALLREKSPEEKLKMVVAHMVLGRKLRELGEEYRKKHGK